MLSRLISRVPRRQFSKYIEDNYGKEVHRLANRPGIEVSPLEVFVYACGSFLLVADVSHTPHVGKIPKDSQQFLFVAHELRNENRSESFNRSSK